MADSQPMSAGIQALANTASPLASPAAPPDGFVPGLPAAPQPPDGFVPGAPDDGSYTGTLVPVHVDAKGNWSWAVPDILNVPKIASGLANTAASAVTAPADAYMGRLPMVGPDDQTNPDFIKRALDYTMTTASPGSAALRAGEVIPGELTQALGAPSATQLKSAATAGYQAARDNTTMVPGDAIANMADQLKQTLQSDHGAIPKTAPGTFGILDELSTPPAGGVGTYTGIEAARRGLSTIAGQGGTDGFAAQKAILQLDSFIDQLAPEAADARANYAAAMRSNDLTGVLSKANTGILEQAEARAAASHSGMNLDNTIRGKVASLLQKPSEVGGYSDSEIAAMNDLVQGSGVQNAARRVGNLLGGGGGLGGLASIMAGGWLGGHFLPSELGPEIGAALGPALGASAKGVENALAQRHLNALDELVRQRSPLYQSLQSQGLLTAPAMGRSNFAGRGLAGLMVAPSNPMDVQNSQGLSNFGNWAAAPFISQ